MIGPVVASVHVHDARAGECTNSVAACDGMMVVERVLWAGDSATDPRGLDPDGVARALRSIDPSLAMPPVGPDNSASDCGIASPPGNVFTVSVGVVDPPAVTSVVIAPTAQALARTIPQNWGADAAAKTRAIVCTDISGGANRTHPATVTFRRLIFDNVALLVETSKVPSAADRDLLNRLETALGSADTTLH